ncbi:MAG: ABC transporter permease subunit [Propionibacteriaceae bacterium]
MTTLPLLRRSLADGRRSLVAWALGVAAAVFLYVPLYPSIGGNAQMRAMLDSLPPGMIQALGYDDIVTGAGYVSATFYGLLGFAMLVIAATSWGTAAIAGEEESGALELTLAHAVSRRQVVAERWLAVALRLAVLTAVAGVLVLSLNSSADLEVDVGGVLAISAAFLGLGMLCSTAAVAVGALTGRRVYALAAGAGLAVVGYAVNAVANQNADLDRWHVISPYHWAFGAKPLASGPDWGGLGLLWGGTALLLAVAVVALDRRDLRN